MSPSPRLSPRMSSTHLEDELGGEGELVALKQAPGGVLEDGGGDAVDEVGDPLLQALIGRGLLHRLLEHHAERLRGGVG